jgi:hypothetical protein
METQLDPRKYFKFTSCPSCLEKPCDRLRFGGVFPGKFILVRNASLCAGLADCPFVARDIDEIDRLLSTVSPEELLDRIDGTIQLLAPDELMQVHQLYFMNGPHSPGALIRALWEYQLIGVIRIPQFFMANASIRKWLFAYEGLAYLLHKPELAKESKKTEVTDALADEQNRALNNPRWEHIDTQRAKDSPDIAAIGDKVRLMASATGFSDGAGVSFDLFDASGGSPEKFDSASGKVDAGRAEAEWTVADPNNAGDKLDLQFEASANDKRTEKAKIPIKFVFEILLQIDVDDPKAQDDVLILLDENNAEVKKLPVKDMKEISEDMVLIVIENIDMDKKYTLIRDYGAEDDGGHDPLFIQLTPKELMKFSKAPDEEEEGEDSEDAEDGKEDAESDGGENGTGANGSEEAEGDGDQESPDDVLDHSWAQDDSNNGAGESEDAKDEPKNFDEDDDSQEGEGLSGDNGTGSDQGEDDGNESV